ncbi:ribonuclease H family protein, partial [Morganella morganii]|uniref:ribonuclease H family protein n=1 Tax=Morganella morganii TaxID=582 RepID=UPI0032DB07F5
MDIDQGRFQPGKHIAQELLKFPDENLTKQQVQQFLGIINYIRDFVPNIAPHVSTLTKMLKKSPPKWSTEQTKAIRWMKEHTKELPPLHIPAGEGLRILQTDASDYYWGAVLLQEVKGKRLVCGYSSGRFKDAELHYHSTYKEILAVKNGIKKFNFHL